MQGSLPPTGCTRSEAANQPRCARSGARTLARALAALLLLGVAAASPPTAAAEPVALFSYIESERMPALVGSLDRSRIADRARVYYGTYLSRDRV